MYDVRAEIRLKKLLRPLSSPKKTKNRYLYNNHNLRQSSIRHSCCDVAEQEFREVEGGALLGQEQDP